MTRILVTGANGFIGRRLSLVLSYHGFVVRTAFRSNISKNDYCGHEPVIVGDIDLRTQWEEALSGVDYIVHLAGRVHMMADNTSDSLSLFRTVNVEGSINLAEQAAKAGVKRLIFLSSVKVNGDISGPGKPFMASTAPSPVGSYAVSKYEAEQLLLKLASETEMDIVIIRPPLVYGPGVKANFLTLMQWLEKGVPLPLGAINNRRSMVYIDNLVDLIRVCIDHPAASNQIFLVSDGNDLSTTDLLQKMGLALGRKAKLIPISSIYLGILAKALGRQALAKRLLGSLQVDISSTKEYLGWEPLVKVDEAFKQTAKSYLNRR